MNNSKAIPNSERYRFSDFALDNYKRLLELALSRGYVFSDYRLEEQAKERILLRRHQLFAPGQWDFSHL